MASEFPNTFFCVQNGTHRREIEIVQLISVILRQELKIYIRTWCSCHTQCSILIHVETDTIAVSYEFGNCKIANETCASVEVLTKRGQFIISSLPFLFRKIESARIHLCIWIASKAASYPTFAYPIHAAKFINILPLSHFPHHSLNAARFHT